MAKKWKLLHRTLQLKSKWVTVYADRLLDNDNNELEYWHYDRADSAVVIAIQGGLFVLPPPQYRVGVDEVMLDFAGSRVEKHQSPEEAVKAVLKRELDVDKSAIKSLNPINVQPLAVDSSFSSQRLHGYVAYIDENAILPASARTFEVLKANELRSALNCAQCLLLLDELILQNKYLIYPLAAK